MYDQAITTDNLNDLFKDKARNWQQYESGILQVAEKIEISFTDAKNELQDTRKAMSEAIQDVVQRANRPEVVLATTGTTSSGKSTLANFLIGEEVLPSAVQEMSAGLVIIHHHETRQSLKILPTAGARWETGEWDDLTAKDVRKRLAATMEAYRKVEEENPVGLDAVQFELNWPIRLAEDKARLGLPAGTRLTIFDLPGLKSMNDKRNGPVIQRHISKALCLVVYNASETDSDKQKKLLNEIADQVKNLRVNLGSDGNKFLGRMLFVLNRIDEFYKDSDPEKSLDKFKAAITEQLQEKLLEALPQEESAINAIEPVGISSLPALLAAEAGLPTTGTDRQIELLEKIEELFMAIFTKNYWKQFPRDLNDFSDDERHRLIKETLSCAKVGDFEENLLRHMKDNLPELILGIPTKEAFVKTGEFLRTLEKFLQGHVERTESEVNEAVGRLKIIQDTLIDQRDKAVDLLKKLKIDDITSRTDIPILRGNLSYIAEELFIKKNKLFPICDNFNYIFIISMNKLASYCDSILNDNPEDPGTIEDTPNFEAFHTTLLALKASDYGLVWKDGGKFENSHNTSEMRKSLQNFIAQLSVTATHMFKRAALEASVFSENAFRIVSEKLLKDIESKGHQYLEKELEEFPGLKTIFNSEIKFQTFTPPSVKFHLDLEEWEETEEQTVTETVQERRWFTLFLFKTPTEKSKKIDVDVSGIFIPDLGEIFSMLSKDPAIDIVIENYLNYLMGMIDTFSNSVSTCIDKGIDGYRQVITKNVQKAAQQDADNKQKINPLLEQVKTFLDYHSSIGKQELTGLDLYLNN